MGLQKLFDVEYMLHNSNTTESEDEFLLFEWFKRVKSFA